MCGRFSQSMTREEYLSLLANEAERNIAYDPEPIGRYNVAPGTRVLLLSERDEQLQLDPVHLYTSNKVGYQTANPAPITRKHRVKKWDTNSVSHA